MRASASTAVSSTCSRAREVREEDLRVREVGGDLDLGDRHQADARILDLVAQQIGEFALDLVADPLCALRRFLHVGKGGDRAQQRRARRAAQRVRETSTIS